MKYSSWIILLLLNLPLFVAGQNSYSSPYSFVGIGDIIDGGKSRTGLMGGTGIASGSGNYINNLNPAGLYAMDSLAVLFDLEVDFVNSNWKSLGNSSSHKDANLNYLAFATRPTKNWAFSFGISPFSKSGYEMTDYISLPGDDFSYSKVFEGSGGVNTFFLSNSFSVHKNISLGLKLSYLFGNQFFSEEVIPDGDYYQYNLEETRYTSTFNAEYGLNLHKDFGESNLSLGLIYSNRQKMNYRSEFLIYGSNGLLINQYNVSSTDVYLPQKLGTGFAFNYKKRLVISSDFSVQDWSNSGLSSGNISMLDERRYSAGIEYSFKQRPIMKRTPPFAIFVGGFYDEGNIKIYGKRLDKFGFSTGIEIPVKRSINSLRLIYSYDEYGFQENGLTKITNHSVKLSFTLQDYWFMRRKYE